MSGRVDQSPVKRLIYGLGSPCPPSSRSASPAGLAKGRHLGRFAASLPLIALFYTVGRPARWSATSPARATAPAGWGEAWRNIFDCFTHF